MHGSPLFRRLTAWTMLGLYGLVASGLPLPLPAPPAAGSAAATKLAAKDRSRPFPCMDKPCGCATAEQCFTNCCCHTPAERLAWARARGLEPAVLAALERRAIAAEPVPAAGSCCAAKPAKPAEPARPSCCEETERPVAVCRAQVSHPADDAVCSDYSSLAAEPASQSGDAADEGARPARGVIVLRAMLACGGIVAQWAAACVSLPPPLLVACEIAWPQVGTVALNDQRALGTGGPPDLPPPRA